MSGFVNTLAVMDGGGVRRTFGTAYWDGSRWWAVVGGNPLDARWLDPIQPLQGGKIVVDILTDGQGQSSALVLGGYTDQPRPSTGTIDAFLPAGPSNRIVFTGEDGVSYTTDRAIGSYDLGDPIYITWDAATPTIIGKVPTVTITPPAQPPAPSAQAPASGYETITANATDTYGVGGWGRWAGSINGGEDLYTGAWSGQSLTGSWFYGAPPAVLAGKTITKIQFRLPTRLTVGSYNAPVTVNLYAHTSSSRPGGDVTRTVGPHAVTVDPRSGPVWVELPTTFAPALVAGGGISIAGGSYAGFASRLDDPQSGKLILDWAQ